MTVQCKFERSLLTLEEYEVIRATHHPSIQDRPSNELRAARGRLREMRDKEPVLVRKASASPNPVQSRFNAFEPEMNYCARPDGASSATQPETVQS
jgi:hypothetical protein